MGLELGGKIGRARVTQIDRVNGGTKPQNSSISALQEQIKRLQDLLHEERKKSAQKDIEIESYKERLAAHDLSDFSGATIYMGRPVITPAQAADRAGTTIYTVSRYLNSNYWQGAQLANGRWFVFADQPLHVKRRK